MLEKSEVGFLELQNISESQFVEQVERLQENKKKVSFTVDEISMAIQLLDKVETNLGFFLGELIMHQQEKSIPALLHALDTETTEIRKKALFLLSKIVKSKKGKAQVRVDSISTYLTDPDPKIRKNTAVIIGQIGEEKDTPLLFEAIRQEEINWVKPSILLAIGNIGGEEAVAFLKEHKADLEEERTALQKALDKNKVFSVHSRLKSVLPVETLINVQTYDGLGFLVEKEVKKIGLEALKKDEKSVTVQTNDIQSLYSLRTFSECLFPEGELEAKPHGLAEAFMKHVQKKQILKKILSYHESNEDKQVEENDFSMAYRIELKDKHLNYRVQREIKLQIIKEMGEYDPSFRNSVSDYQIEFRLVREKGNTYKVYWKPYTIEDLRFIYRKNDVPASIHPVVAASIVEYTNKYRKPNAKVMDPFCGSGTMLVERSKSMPYQELVGIDIVKEAIEGAKENVKLAGVQDIRFIHSDILSLSTEGKYDEILSNMPFGIRVNNHEKNESLYEGFFRLLDPLLNPGALIILFTQEIELTTRLFKKHKSLQLLDVTRISVGGLRPALFIGKRK
jgi:23S rRNA G2445 N2-methylase RlmL